MRLGRSAPGSGGGFWLAVEGGEAAGTIGLMSKDGGCAALKKFLVNSKYRSQRVGLALYRELLEFAEKNNINQIILDTPPVAGASHRFYELAGFKRIERSELPVEYSYSDRDSLLYLLKL